MFSRLAVTLFAVGVLSSPPRLDAQESLEQAARQVRSAFLQHDVSRLLGNSESVTLRLQGFRGVSSAGRRQAGRVLRDFLSQATEVGFRIIGAQRVGSTRGVVEAHRRYVVKGTSDELSQVVFVTFRRSGGGWAVSEIRMGGR